MIKEIETHPTGDVITDASLRFSGLDPMKLRALKGWLSYQDKLHDLKGEVLKKTFSPFLQEYKAAQIHNPELIDYTWQGIWKNIGEAVGYSYKIPACDRTADELDKLKAAGKFVLLLPDDIYTPEGLVRVARAFPRMGAFFGDFDLAARISHQSDKGGCIDIEMSIGAPYIGGRWHYMGYDRKELQQRIQDDGRMSQRLPTYIIGAQFSELLTGHYFDTLETSSRLTGSVYRGKELRVWFDSEGQFCYVVCQPHTSKPALGGRSEGRKI